MLLLLEIIISLVLVFGILGYMIFKIIPLSIKLLRIRIKRAEEYVEQYQRKENYQKTHIIMQQIVKNGVQRAGIGTKRRGNGYPLII